MPSEHCINAHTMFLVLLHIHVHDCTVYIHVYSVWIGKTVAMPVCTFAIVVVNVHHVVCCRVWMA